MLGIFTAIGGAIGTAISTVGGAIGTALSAAGTWLAGAAAKIGPIITKFADGFLGVVAKIPGINIDTIKNVIETAGKIVSSICELFGIMSEDSAEILGAKAEAAEKTLADFDNDTEAYIKYLKEKIELDQAKFDEMSAEQKMGCKAVGIALEAKAIEERIGGIRITPEYIATLAKIHMGGNLNFSAQELVDMITGLKDAGITDMSDLADYLEGKGDSDRVKTGQALRSVLEKMDAEKSTDEVVEDMKQAVRRFGEE